MIEPGSIVLTKRERRTAIRLLGLLQGHLESAIDGCTLANGTVNPNDKAAVKNVALDRRDWKAAEQMVKKLEAGLRV